MVMQLAIHTQYAGRLNNGVSAAQYCIILAAGKDKALSAAQAGLQQYVQAVLACKLKINDEG